MPDTSVPPCMPLVPFKLLSWYWSSEGVSLCLDSLRRTAWGSSSFFHWLNPHWFLQPEVVGTKFPGTRTLGQGTGVGWDPCSQRYPSRILSPTGGWGTSPFCACTPPSSLDGCGFFNSTVRLPFNSISDSSEWWLFYILVVILMWLCEEVSHVCLCHPLDRKSPLPEFYNLSLMTAQLYG